MVTRFILALLVLTQISGEIFGHWAALNAASRSVEASNPPPTTFSGNQAVVISLDNGATAELVFEVKSALWLTISVQFGGPSLIYWMDCPTCIGNSTWLQFPCMSDGTCPEHSLDTNLETVREVPATRYLQNRGAAREVIISSIKIV